MARDAGPGVPEALPQTLRLIGDQLGASTLDQIWIFPPLVRGRCEWGLVAVSRLDDSAEGSDDEDQGPQARRRLYTAVYSAERTGAGLRIEPSLSEEGAAPRDRLPRVMDGVVRRSRGELGDPREVMLGGSEDRWSGLLSELDPEDAGTGPGHES